MLHEKAEVEVVYFSGSDYNDNIMGFKMNPERVFPELARERARRPTSNAPSNTTDVSLEMIVRRVALLLNKPEGYVQPVLDTFHRIGIRNCDTLDSTLSETLNDRQQMERFTIWFEGSSDGLRLCFRQLQYYRCCSMYMNIRWNHDHEYFQRMIEWERRMENEVVDEVVGAVITNLHKLLNDDSSSDDNSRPGLQERGREDSSSSDGSSMPLLQDRAREDSSSDDDTKSCEEDGIYCDGEHCGYKARTLKQIISTNSVGGEDYGDRFHNSSMALFKYSLLGPTQFQIKYSAHPKLNFCQAKG